MRQAFGTSGAQCRWPRRWRCGAVSLVAAFLFTPAHAADPLGDATSVDDIVAEPPYRHMNEFGYRASHYRGLTPGSTAHGETLLDAVALVALLEREPNAALIDVQAITMRPETVEFDMGWLPNEPRYHLNGSRWLPNVGAAELDETMDGYFRRELNVASDGRRDHPIVIYCVLDCWMSWNAVKRAHGYGYTRLYWYRAGSDGWEEAGLPLVEGTPIEIDESVQ